MKKNILFLFTVILVIGCKNNIDYTVKTYYLKTTSDGLSSIVISKHPLTAQTDSLAYRKANSEFESMKQNSVDKNITPLQFELYNTNDQLVVINFWETHKMGALQKPAEWANESRN